MGGSRHIGFRALTAHCSPQTSCLHRASPKSRKGRFLNVIFESSNFATLIYQKISQRSVYAGCIIPVCCECTSLLWRYTRHTSFIIRVWRGLAELFILVNRQCEGQDEWDKQGSFSHVFFMSITRVLTSNAEAGRVVGGLWYGIV